MDLIEILIRNNYIPIQNSSNKEDGPVTPKNYQAFATFLSNLAYFGYAPSPAATKSIINMNKTELASIWEDVEPALSIITGANHKITDYILYKNFPNEVLEMSEAEYLIKQILVYIGAPYEFVSQVESKKTAISNELKLKILSPAFYTNINECDEIEGIQDNLISQKTRWSQEQSETAKILSKKDTLSFSNLSNYGFKENGILLICDICQSDFNFDITSTNSLLNHLSNEQKKLLLSFTSPKETQFPDVKINDATDVLRLAHAFSGNGADLRQAKRLKNFTKKERKFLLKLLESSKNIESDCAERKNLFKRLFKQLRPNEFKNKYPVVCNAYNKLYNNELHSFNSKIEGLIQSKSEEVFDLLKTRSGLFTRMFHRLYSIYGSRTIQFYTKLINELNTIDLLKFKKYLETSSDLNNFLVTPNGSWDKVQVIENKKIKISSDDLSVLTSSINNVLTKRILEKFPNGFNSCKSLEEVKFQSNSQQLANYGKGTVFNLPENISFIRTSSFWDIDMGSFLDNTWNFFDANWNPVSYCGWSNEQAGIKREDSYSVFSGDAINTKDGKSAQLIDLYLDKMQESNVKFAVWSILSYNNIPLSSFSDAHAGMQLGESAVDGKLFEPSRVTFSFNLKEKAISKIVAYIDVENRKIIYCDVNKKLNVTSGSKNFEDLSEFMPLYIEYLKTLPTWYDLISLAHNENGTQAAYSDIDFSFDTESCKKGLSFKKENETCDYEKIDISLIIDN